MTGLATSYFPADESRPVLDLSVGALLRAAAAEAPERTALVSIAPERAPMSWTYAELLDDAEHAAAWLLERFAPGDHVAVWAPNLPEWVVLQYGAALAGMVLVTTNPALRGPELEYALRQSRAVAVAYAESFRGTDMASLVTSVLPAVPGVRAVPLTDWLADVRAVDVAGLRLPEVDPASATQIQFTSGTTGSPKAAVLTHRAMVTNAGDVRTRADSPDGAVWLSAMPLFHTAGCGLVGIGNLVQRGTLVLAELFEPGLLLDAVGRYGAQVLAGVPAMLKALLAHPAAASGDYGTLEVVMSGGDAVPADLIAACEATFGVGFSTVYGQTELSPIVTQTSPDDSVEDNRGTAGRPLWNVEVAILDAETGAVLPVGAEGEICARGYQRMLGYLDMPEATAATIDADGWLHTGDLGTMDARGYVRVTGRLKDMIIRGGENIYPREIEDVLLQHPAVGNAVVVGIDDPDWGESVAAIVQLAPGAAAPTAADLHDLVRGRLAPHKTPKAWYVSADLPTNAMGKLQKFRLRDQIAAGALAPLESR
ncbi:class I adenylate-forming enzyme family protein [Nocardioides sp. BYT-33-1]|uniref:class I adenylate-forming enzyme family protein n=1 Tax=Nocardioides sp. BYT-33-1 TaxID=3416952 RepID=UPI003F52CC22